MKLSVLALLTGTLLSGCVAVEVPRGTTGPDSSATGQGGRDGYTFTRTRSNGEPVRWSTCEPIRYVIRPAHEPDGARRLLRQSVQRIEQATGLTFSFEGTTDEAPRPDRRPFHENRYGDGWSPVLVAYSDPDEYPRLEGRVAGDAGPVSVNPGDGTPRYVSGTLVLDADQLGSLSEDAVRAVMLHELGHVVGLAHVKDRGQLMNAVQYGREVLTLQDGDLAGLEELGKGECYEPVTPRAP